MEPSISVSYNIDFFEINNDSCVFRCANCLQIPLITLCKDNNEPKIKYICECTLSEKNKYKIITIKEFLEKFKQLTLNSMMCNKCNKEIEEVKEMDLCLTCKKPFLDINKIDNYCHIHNDEKIVAWCINCKVNLCSFCFGIHEKCEYRIIDEIKLKDDQIELYKTTLTQIITFFYNKMKALNSKMINNCKDNNEKKEINDLYQKYFEINENMIKLSQESILTYSLYTDKYIYPIIQNTKNLCNLNENIIKKKVETIEEYKNILKKEFIIKYSEIEEPEKTNNPSIPKLSEKNFEELLLMLKNMNLNINDEGKLTNYIPISYVDNPTKTNISKLTCVKTIKSKKTGYYTNILDLKNNTFAITIGKTIEIYSLNNYKLLKELTEHQYDIFSLGLFKDNKTFASGDVKGNIKIWNFDNNNNYKCIGNITSETTNLSILKLKHLSTGNLASLTNKSIEIWNSQSPYNNKLKKYCEKDHYYISLLETKNNLLITGSKKGDLIFYNPVDLSIIKQIPFNCGASNVLIELNNDKIAFMGNEGIYIVDTIKKKLEKIIVNENTILSLFCLNDNTILSSEIDNALRQYDYRTCTLIGSIEGASEGTTINTFQINDKFIISAGIISFNIWKFED